MDIREAVETFAYSEGWDATELADDGYIETILRHSVLVQGSRDIHAYTGYIAREVVVRLGEVYICYYNYIIPDDSSLEEVGLSYALDDFKIVSARTHIIVETYYE